MPRARTLSQDDWQTAADQQQGSGCLSLYLLPILAVALITCLLTALSFNTPISTPVQSANVAISSSTSLSPIFTREVQHWSSDIIRWANASSLDPNLVAVVMQIES